MKSMKRHLVNFIEQEANVARAKYLRMKQYKRQSGIVLRPTMRRK